MALESSPSQDGQAFAWWRPRLKNGVKSVSDGTLDKAIATLEDVEFFFAGLVVTGVALEFVLAYLHPAYDSHLARYGTLLCDAYVALGIVGEVAAGMRMRLCEGELTRRSKKELGEANDRLADVEVRNAYLQESADMAGERAANAEREAARLKGHLEERVLTKKQFDAFRTVKGKLAAVTVAYVPDEEARSFALQIQIAFHQVGVAATMYELPAVGGYVGNGLFVYDRNAYVNQDDPSASPTDGEPLTSLVVDAELGPGTFRLGRLPEGVNVREDVPVLFVLKRPPLPSGRIPFWDGEAPTAR